VEEEEGAGAAHPSTQAAPATQDFVPVQAMELILAERHRQIHKFGHTPDADRKLPLAHFAREMSKRGLAIAEYIQFNRPANVRRHAIVLAAIAMALIDRIDAEFPGE
jgi:hypothetical protein